MKSLVALFVLLFASPFASAATSTASSNSRWEGRAHYGAFLTKPNDFNDQMEGFVTGVPDLEAPKISGVDILLKLNSAVLGLRYEVLKYDKAGNGRISGALVNTQTNLDGMRVDLLGGWRFYNSTSGYAGILAHYGVMTDVKYKITSTNVGSSTVHEDKFSGKPDSTYGAGIEGGVYLQQKFILGAEVGYTSYLVSKFNDDSDAEVLDKNSKSIKMDLSGGYYKVFIGMTF